MNVLFSFIITLILILIPVVGVGLLNLHSLFGIVIPYVAFLIFFFGLIYRIVNWARSPQPFKIPTTCGQQKSLPWIKHSRLESPFTMKGVYLRMFFEVFFFRSLFKNLRADLVGKRLIYGSAKWLWLGAILFHLSFLVIMLRHLRFFTHPVSTLVDIIAKVDGFFQLGIPPIYHTDLFILAGLSLLLLRRLVDSKVNYLSHASDYFPLFFNLRYCSEWNLEVERQQKGYLAAAARTVTVLPKQELSEIPSDKSPRFAEFDKRYEEAKKEVKQGYIGGAFNKVIDVLKAAATHESLPPHKNRVFLWVGHPIP